ncbi:unnamed protein product [Amoebophrya sp. A120]|nr:unnamed protein product [Amoebophrya sp. A120]|eukprot:GSA120T00002340001.1
MGFARLLWRFWTAIPFQGSGASGGAHLPDAKAGAVVACCRARKGPRLIGGCRPVSACQLISRRTH